MPQWCHKLSSLHCTTMVIVISSRLFLFIALATWCLRRSRWAKNIHVQEPSKCTIYTNTLLLCHQLQYYFLMDVDLRSPVTTASLKVAQAAQCIKISTNVAPSFSIVFAGDEILSLQKLMNYKNSPKITRSPLWLTSMFLCSANTSAAWLVLH